MLALSVAFGGGILGASRVWGIADFTGSTIGLSSPKGIVLGEDCTRSIAKMKQDTANQSIFQKPHACRTI